MGNRISEMGVVYQQRMRFILFSIYLFLVNPIISNRVEKEILCNSHTIHELNSICTSSEMSPCTIKK